VHLLEVQALLLKVRLCALLGRELRNSRLKILFMLLIGSFVHWPEQPRNASA
jgi:hypothetical protein